MKHAYDVTLVTYEKYPNLAPDDVVLRDAFVSCGASVRSAVWSDSGVDWSASPLTLLRATWDYPQRFAEFNRWLARVEVQTTLINDSETVRWNWHKRYLAELERSGIEIVPTIFVESGRPFDLTVECTSRGWDDVVIKPCIGGSSYGARRVRGGEIAAGGVPHLQALLGNAEAMVQPFLHETETAGELACIFIDGTFTHAVRKPPFNSSTETTSEHVCELTADDRSFVNRIVGSLARVPAYARVDIVPTALGTLLMELELIEPSLYFALEPSAAQRLAERVLRMPAPSS